MSQSQNRGTRRNYSGQKKRNVRKKRKNYRYNYARIAIAGILLIIAITAIVFGAKAIKKAGTSETAVSSIAETTTEPETDLVKEVIVDNISITGMSRSEAKDAILKNYKWNMTIVYSDQTYKVSNLVSQKIDELLEKIFTDSSSKSEYSLDLTGLESAAALEAASAAAMWDKPAHNGSISGFNKESGSFTYSGEESGLSVDKDYLKDQILNAVSSKQFDIQITAKVSTVAPEITEAQAKAMYGVIGTYTTKTTSNKDRNTNINIACQALDGLILQPGEEFSFNNTTGNRTEAKGYRPAGAYQNGVLVEEPGGGVCQVSSTLYNAVVFSGLTTTERHAHSYEPSYVTPGEDAMVSYDGYSGPDMKFVNSSNTAIAIRAKYASQSLTISIVGIRILEPGITLSMHSEKVAELDPPSPEYEEDQTLEPGVQVEKKAAKNGSRWSTNLITKKDGVVISNEFFHSSTYKGKPATVRRNSSGVVIPASTENPESIEESSSVIESSVSESESLQSPGAPKETTKAVEVGPGITTAAETAKAETTKAETTKPQSKPGEGPGVPSSSAQTAPAQPAPTQTAPAQTAPAVPTTDSNAPTTPQTTAENIISPNTIAPQSAEETTVPQGPH